MTIQSLRKQTSKLVPNFVMAIALVTGTAMVAGHFAPAEAQAQRSKKKKDKKKKGKSQYSKEFVAAYTPVDEALKAPDANVAALRPQIDALLPLAKSADEQIAAGGLAYNAGNKSSDRALQLQGMEMMIASGKVPISNTGQYNFIAYQLSNALSDFPKARTYLQAAINNNFSNANIGKADLEIAMAESYFSGEEYVAGLDYLDRAIKGRKAAGQEVKETWYRRGITIAYNNEIQPQVYDMALAWVSDFPSAKNWRDTINLARNLNEFEGQDMLDLFRLSQRVDALQDKLDYDIYVESADPRRLPKEVKEIIEQGYSRNIISKDDIFIADSLTTANSRIASDRAELPALERDAAKPNAALIDVMAAADTLLSYGEYSKAETFYKKALAMPGVDQAKALTRLGIAQVGLSQFAAAKETLDKVKGARMPIARLWSGYAAMQGGESTSNDGPSLGELMGV